MTYAKHRAKVAKRRGYLTPTPANDRARPISQLTKAYRASVSFGEDVEHAAITAFCEGDMPPWFVRVRPSTEAENNAARYAEDAAGVDLWVDTDRGPIPVQVKSSAERAARFREEHPEIGIAVVVLHRDMEPERIRSRIIEAAQRAYSLRGRHSYSQPKKAA